MIANDMDGLINSIIQRQEVSDKVDTILAQIGNESATGAELWKTLVYSGVALGIEQTQERFYESTVNTVALIRTSVDRLEKATLATNDFDTIKSLGELRNLFSDMLVERSRVLYGMYTQKIEDATGIHKKYMEPSLELAAVSAQDLALVGFTIYEKVPAWFYAWNHFVQDKTLTNYECKCAGCLITALRKERVVSTDKIENIIKLYSGMDKMYEAFGTFALATVRTNIDEILAGTTHIPEYDTEDASKTTSDIMSFLRTRLEGK